MANKDIILSLANETDGKLMVGVTSDGQALTNAIYSFLSMCDGDSMGELGSELSRAIVIGVGEWLEDLPIERSAQCLNFLSKCVADAQEQKSKERKYDC